MRWFDNKESHYRSTTIPFKLYAINSEIYDEIVTKSDGYYLIKRCGEKPAVLGHGETQFITDGKVLIYPLPQSEIKEIKLGWIPAHLLGEFTRVGFNSSSIPTMTANVKVDRRYIEERSIINTKDFWFNSEYNSRRKAFVDCIYGTVGGIGYMKPDGYYYIKFDIYNQHLKIDEVEVCIVDKLYDGERIKWNSSKSEYELLRNNDVETMSQIKKIELPFSSTKNRFVPSSGFNIDVYYPTKKLRPLDVPSEISVYNVGLKKGVKWKHVLGAERYEVYLNGSILETTEYNGFASDKEFEGYMKVRALNEFSQSVFTDEFYIKSIPNEPFIAFVDNHINEDNQHVFRVSFADYSELETCYKIRYSVDGREDIVVDLPASPGMGTIYNYNIVVPNITNSFKIRVSAVNEIGETDVMQPIIKYIIDQPRWTYKTQSKELLLEWINRVEDAVRYKIIMTKNGVVDDDYAPVDVPIGGSIRYQMNLLEDEEVAISIVPIDSNDVYHIYTKPTKMSKSLDKTLIAPTLKHNKISATNHEFFWDDIYTCENSFEVIYSFSGGEVKRETIDSTTVVGTGRVYRFNYNFETHGYVNVRVRMLWDLGESEYSKEVIAYHVPASGLPPTGLKRSRVGNKIVLTWDGQEYVDDYEISIKTGYLEQEKLFRSSENSYRYELPVKPSSPPKPLTPQELNKWKIVLYPNSNAVGQYPIKEWFNGLQPTGERILTDHLLSLSLNLGEQYLGLATTYVYVENFCTVENKMRADDRASIYLNDKIIAPLITGTYSSCTFNFVPGWNKIEVILLELNYSDGFQFEQILSQNPLIKKLTYEDRFVKSANPRMEIKVKTHFLNEDVSQFSAPMVFTPDASDFNTLGINITKTSLAKEVNSATVNRGTNNPYSIQTKNSTLAKTPYTPITRILTRHTLGNFPLASEIRGKALRTIVGLDSSIIRKNDRQFAGHFTDLSITKTAASVNVDTSIKTMINQSYLMHTHINKVTIVCIGDSITSGHPGWWAETGTGDIRSQYEYWLNIRLKNQFTIINKGYGSDTTDDILARFDRDVFQYYCQYCIIQGGTNDLYWAMAEASGDKAYLDAKVEQMKNNIVQMVRRCWDRGVTPIVGTLIPRTGATGIYKDALYEYNEWIITYCTSNENIFYIDFFNAGKDKVPATPLEDPANPGALNPIYDGDAIYDEYGNLIKQGRGIHPSWQGYRIMAESIPLNIFKTGENGLKLYLDAACTVEEQYNDDDKVNPYYEIDISGIRRGVTKKLIRYVKNVGNSQNLFVAYSYDNHNIDMKFLDVNGKRVDYVNGVLPASARAKLEMVFDVQDKDSKAKVNLYLASREFKTK